MWQACPTQTVLMGKGTACPSASDAFPGTRTGSLNRTSAEGTACLARSHRKCIYSAINNWCNLARPFSSSIASIIPSPCCAANCPVQLLLTLNHSPPCANRHLTFLRGTSAPVSSKRPAALSLSRDASRVCSMRPFVSRGSSRSNLASPFSSCTFSADRSSCGTKKVVLSVPSTMLPCRVSSSFVSSSPPLAPVAPLFFEQITSCDAMPRRVTTRKPVRNARSKPRRMRASNSKATGWFGAATEIV
mmetsp:Transcript_5612/g.34809  ORF Transcript_5612/g.34809 Transcript_5612/m.34809 type:complete len:246 (+) Transcript_5612:153-890(+)